MEDFVWGKVSLWVSKIEKLSRIANFQPQPGIGELFQSLEEVYWHQFLPALTSREALSGTERAVSPASKAWRTQHHHTYCSR